MPTHLLRIACVFCVSFTCHTLFGQSNQTLQDQASLQDQAVLAGHSYHGEAFNEGPRQHAYLMSGLGRSQFEVSTNNSQAEKFFQQGIDQLHGFWYFEAERSFRQVVILDPNCAMAYWGLAMANVNNEERAGKFIRTATDKAQQEDSTTSEREKLYIEALAAYYNQDVKNKKNRAEDFANKLEEIVLQYPHDIEAKAFLACQLWMNQRAGLNITSHVAVNALLDQVFEVDPRHPAHHYRIHLWDYKKPSVALRSAALCGPSLPDIAHMWHMPGHIYSRLKRYDDAVWQQEASARVDHRNMMHDQVMPDQIHNFAHNNEWCVRNLNNVGRVRDAIDLATNMISLPRHPKYNHLNNRGSTWYGRQRLFETLSRYELWQELIENCNSAILEPTDDERQQIRRFRYLGRAHFRLGNLDQFATIQSQLQQKQQDAESRRRDIQTELAATEQQKTLAKFRQSQQLLQLVPAKLRPTLSRNLRNAISRDSRKRKSSASRKALKKFDDQINVINRALDEMAGYQLIVEGNYQQAEGMLKKAGQVDPIYRASILAKAGDFEQAKNRAAKHVENHENEVQPLAMYSWFLWEAGKLDDAVQAFERLRTISGSIDMDSPIFRRLQPVARHGEITGDWRLENDLPEDIGQRPDLESLGPFRWQPVPAPEWQLIDSNQQLVSSKQYQGQPVIVIFYLGHGCLHCAEQLQAFAPKLEEYRDAGIEMVAISTDDRAGLKKSIESYGDEPLPIQLLANPEFDVFQSFRVFDEFEDQPLHGTFLIDGRGRIRWQDVSYEPFMDPNFLLRESRRLLDQTLTK